MRCTKVVKKNREVSGVTYKLNHPCGLCMPCRITKRQEWTFRLLAEMKYTHSTYFITLTYDNEHLPQDNQLDKTELQNFFKRLRKNTGEKFRYFGVGEYGGKTGRAHYHALIYASKEYPIKQKNISNQTITTDSVFHTAWQDRGYVDVVPIPSYKDGVNLARYISGYTLKKLTKDQRLESDKLPEFSLMSRKPALGTKQAISLANNLKTHNIPISTFTGDHQKQGIYMVNYKGKKWPLDKTMRNIIIKQYGGDSRTEQTKARQLDAKITFNIHACAQDHEAYLDFIADTKAGHLYDQAKKTQKI